MPKVCEEKTYWHGEEIEGDIVADDGNFGSFILVGNAIKILQNGPSSSGNHAWTEPISKQRQKLPTKEMQDTRLDGRMTDVN